VVLLYIKINHLACGGSCCSGRAGGAPACCRFYFLPLWLINHTLTRLQYKVVATTSADMLALEWYEIDLNSIK
jgi:hypothetical protein